MSRVSIRDLSRGLSAVVDQVERSGLSTSVTREGKPIAALVRVEQDNLDDWLLSAAADRQIGVSLEESPEALRAAALPIAYGSREIEGLTKAEADGFAEALAE